MCQVCCHGVLGRSPDGETVFCTCEEGLQAAVDDSRATLMAYAEQLNAFDSSGDLVPTMQIQREAIQVAFDAEVIWHDYYAQQLDGR